MRLIRSLIARFHRGEEASLTVEAVIILPLLLWAFVASYAFYDAYRHKALAMKGNYGISDLLSRETDPINMTYLRGIEDVFEYFTRSPNANAWVRVTPVRCRKNCANPNTRVLKRDWSKATDGHDILYNSDVNGAHYRALVPMIAKGERVIMVETNLTYTPMFQALVPGLGSQRVISDVVMTRPRFAPQLCWGSLTCIN